jgi:hypothetical protein
MGRSGSQRRRRERRPDVFTEAEEQLAVALRDGDRIAKRLRRIVDQQTWSIPQLTDALPTLQRVLQEMASAQRPAWS